MAQSSITVRELSRPTITQIMYQFRDERYTGTVANITGWTIELVVKRDIADDDDEALFTLAAILTTPASGVYTFALTEEHTALSPGSYPAEIHWWINGATLTDPPTDAVAISFDVEPAIAPR